MSDYHYPADARPGPRHTPAVRQSEWPYLEMRNALRVAAETVEQALRDTADSFRDEDGGDHAPQDFTVAYGLASVTATALRDQAERLRERAEAEEQQWLADDEYWTRG